MFDPALLNLVLMPNPHTIEGSRRICFIEGVYITTIRLTIAIISFSTDPFPPHAVWTGAKHFVESSNREQVKAVRIVLSQPSPHWTQFGITRLKIYAAQTDPM